MADAGNLQKLPLEIRKEIYKHLLVEHKKIGIMRHNRSAGNKVARMDNHHNANHRRKVWDSHKRRWVAAPPSVASLLLVNKQISQEAKEALYGLNHFEFEHAGALESFLEHTGDGSSYLRHIALIGKGISYRNSWASMDRCLTRLTKAQSLRTLEISHLAVCNPRAANLRDVVEIKELVEHCKPLLEALHARYQRGNLKIDVFDVIKITLPCPYVYDVLPRRYPCQVLCTRRSRTGKNEVWQNCSCDRGDTPVVKNVRLVQKVEEEITNQLGLEVGAQDESEG